MRIPDTRGVLSRLYTDRMSVQRYGSYTDSDGATQSGLIPEPVLESVPCRVSFRGHDAPGPVGDGNPIVLQPLLICAPDVPIRSGDYVTVTRTGRDGDVLQIYAGNIGQPNPYHNSLQTLFQDKGVS